MRGFAKRSPVGAGGGRAAIQFMTDTGGKRGSLFERRVSLFQGGETLYQSTAGRVREESEHLHVVPKADAPS